MNKIIFCVLSFSLLFAMAVPGHATLSGYATYFVPGNEQSIVDMYQDHKNDPMPWTMRKVGIALSRDFTRVYYDHWEDGFDPGLLLMPPIALQDSTEVYDGGFGDSYLFHSDLIPVGDLAYLPPTGSGRDPAYRDTANISGYPQHTEVDNPPLGSYGIEDLHWFPYDGRDKVVVAGSPAYLATFAGGHSPDMNYYENADTWELVAIKPLMAHYEMIQGYDLFEAPKNYFDFDRNYAFVTAIEDGTVVEIDDPAHAGVEISILLDSGECYLYDGNPDGTEPFNFASGTTIHATNGEPIMVNTANALSIPPSNPNWIINFFVALPDELLANDYISSLPALTQIYIHNPHDFAIDVQFESGDPDPDPPYVLPAPLLGTIAANGTISFTDLYNLPPPWESGSLGNVGVRFRSLPLGTGPIFNVLAIGDPVSDPAPSSKYPYHSGWTYYYDKESEYFVPIGTENYTSGSGEQDDIGNPIYVTPVEEQTTFFLDYDADGEFDDEFVAGQYDCYKIWSNYFQHCSDVGDVPGFDGNDYTGMRIFADGNFSAIWVEAPDDAVPQNEKFHDAGYTISPLAAAGIEAVFAVDKTADTDKTCPDVGLEVEYEVTLSSIDIFIGVYLAKDILPPGWSYIDGSSKYQAPGGSLTTVVPDKTTKGDSEVLTYLFSSSEMDLPADQSGTIRYLATVNGDEGSASNYVLSRGLDSAGNPMVAESSSEIEVVNCAECDVDQDTYLAEECNGPDCDDSNPDINPGATEVCNGVDDNCDGNIDEGGDGLCDDGVFCNGAETCDGANGCQPGTDPCPGQMCDEANDQCVECLQDSHCDDSVACTDDTCVGGSCVYTPNDDLCDDGVFCNGAETCDAAQDCLPGPDPCPGEMCDETGDVCAECLQDSDCDDGVACTDDACSAGECVNTPNDALCDDGVFCNGAETCDAANDCQSGTDPCPGEMCDEAGDVCAECLQDSDCDDGVACTDDSCSAGVCVYTPNDDLCDDSVFCNGAETCDATNDCQPGTNPCPGEMCDESGDVCAECLQDSHCDDGVACTEDSCIGGSCVNIPNDALCDDGVWCNGAETCDATNDCQPGINPCPGEMCDEDGDVCAECLQDSDCDDGVVCTEDSCIGGACVNVPNDALCDDGVWCTGAETCDATNDCQPGINPCIGQMCDEPNDQCVECLLDINCDDGVACTDDACINNECSNIPNNAHCDDAVFCNGSETCDVLNDCQSGTNPCPGMLCDEDGRECADCLQDSDCDDGVSCTDDSCSDGTCTNTPNDAICDDGEFCTGAETCDAINDCQSGVIPCEDDGLFCNGLEICDEDLDFCRPSTGDPCDDGVFCDGTEACDEDTDTCDDPTGNPCTLDEFCNENTETCDDACNGCLVDRLCFENGAVNPRNMCQVCDVATAADAWTNADGIACEDDLFCNGTDSCLGGQCGEHTGNPCVLPGICNEDTELCQVGCDGCVIDDICFMDGHINEFNDCEFCDVAFSDDRWSWLPDGTDCNDSIFCTVQDQCTGGVCNGDGRDCEDDDLFCTGDEACDENNYYDCRSSGDPCDPAIETCNENADTCDPIGDDDDTDDDDTDDDDFRGDDDDDDVTEPEEEPKDESLRLFGTGCCGV